MLWVWLFEDSEIIKFWSSDVVCFTEKLKHSLRDSKAGAYLPLLKQEQLFCNFFAVFFLFVLVGVFFCLYQMEVANVCINVKFFCRSAK